MPCHRSPSPGRALRACALALLLAPAGLIAASAEPGSFDYPAEADYLVLAYTQVHDLIANADPTPLLRVYGDGRAHVHFPVYMQRAGDYQLYLTRGEVETLLASLEAKGLLGLDLDLLRAERRGAEARRKAATGTFFELSDASHTVIEVHLSRYSTGGVSLQEFEQKISWPNVAQEARLYPEVEALARIAAAEAELRELLERGDLQEVN